MALFAGEICNDSAATFTCIDKDNTPVCCACRIAGSDSSAGRSAAVTVASLPGAANINQRCVQAGGVNAFIKS
jgi:hypothetical protein